MIGEAFRPLSDVWRFHEHRDGETALYRMGSFAARVDDYDGETFLFSVGRHRALVRQGDALSFFDAIAAAEAVLVELGALYRPAPLIQQQAAE